MVREASSQGAGTPHSLFLAERRLVRDSVTNHFTIESHVTYPGRIAADDLASMFGLSDVEDVPRFFTLDLEAETRQPCTEGRMVLGTEKSVAILTIKVGRTAALRGETSAGLAGTNRRQGERCTLEGGSALPAAMTLGFCRRRSRKSGSRCRWRCTAAPHESAWVALPPGGSVEADTEAEAVGELLCPGSSTRLLFVFGRMHGWFCLALPFVFGLGQVAPPGQIYQWKAQRLAEAKGRSVFRDRQLPRLFRTTDEGLQSLPQSLQQWRRPGTQELLSPREARGPVEVAILDDGEVVARQKDFRFATGSADRIRLGRCRRRRSGTLCELGAH